MIRGENVLAGLEETRELPFRRRATRLVGTGKGDAAHHAVPLKEKVASPFVAAGK